ncbi:MAG: ABC transporter permease [Actinomycetota bacterium]|nr:ABC transporter permease [Actinomycetota bacterium]
MNRSRLTKVLLPVASFVILLLLWQAVVVLFNVQGYIAPRPLDAIRAVSDNWSLLSPLVTQIVKETVFGFALGALIGVFFGVVMSKIPAVQKLLYPTLVLSQAVPVIVIAFPLAAILGFGSVKPIIAIVVWIVFFPVTVSVIDGLGHVDHDLLNLAKVYGASRWRTFIQIEVPATVSPLFSGLKIGATYAITGAFIGELASPEQVGSTGSSLALYVQHAESNLNSPAVYGITLLMAIIGVAWFLIVAGLEVVSTPWLRRTTRRRWRRRDIATSQGDH